VPVRPTVCGDPEALSATVTEADRLPAEAGVKVTVMVQVAPAASEVPQLLLSPKLLEFVPVMDMPVIVSGAVPVFDRVVDCVAAAVPTCVPGKVSVLLVSVACGAVPIPLSAAVWGEPEALSTTEMEAERLPAEAGVKVTVIRHALSDARLAGQLFV
jgi:hypothetical protein